MKGNSSAELARTKDEYDAFLADRGNLDRVAAVEGAADAEQAKVLRVLRRTFATYVAEDERVSDIKARARFVLVCLPHGCLCHCTEQGAACVTAKQASSMQRLLLVQAEWGRRLCPCRASIPSSLVPAQHAHAMQATAWLSCDSGACQCSPWYLCSACSVLGLLTHLHHT